MLDDEPDWVKAFQVDNKHQEKRERQLEKKQDLQRRINHVRLYDKSVATNLNDANSKTVSVSKKVKKVITSVKRMKLLKPLDLTSWPTPLCIH